MDSFDLCTACSCFIKRTETRCPFCGAEHVHVPRPPVGARRMSRAQWLALGSALVLTSCGGSVQPGPTGTQGSSQHGGDDQGDAQAQADSGQGGGDDTDASTVTGDDASTIGQEDAAGDAADEAVVHAGDAGSCAAGGLFICAGSPCNAGTQFCQMSYGGTDVACSDDNNGGFFPQECVACPTCACVSQHLFGNCQCVERNGGGIGLQCATCYGAPPTRLELLAA